MNRQLSRSSLPVCEKVSLTFLISSSTKLRRSGLTSYGDNEFSLFLRKAFIKGAGYTDDALDRKIIGIIDTGVRHAPLFPLVYQA